MTLDLTAYKVGDEETADHNKFNNLLDAVQAAVVALQELPPASTTLAGTHAARPLATAVAAGTVYFETDTGGAFRSDGTSWLLVNPAAPLDYAQITSSVSVVSGTFGAIITGSSVTYDGSNVKLEFFSPNIQGNTDNMVLSLAFFMDSTQIDIETIHWNQGTGAGNFVGWPTKYEHIYTPTAGAHTFSVKGAISAGGATVQAGTSGAAYGPAFLRVTKA